jgi:hypothetical protein
MNSLLKTAKTIEKYYMLQLDDFGFTTFRALLLLQ